LTAEKDHLETRAETQEIDIMEEDDHQVMIQEIDIEEGEIIEEMFAETLEVEAMKEIEAIQEIEEEMEE
jgi:hypothetical protein